MKQEDGYETKSDVLKSLHRVSVRDVVAIVELKQERSVKWCSLVAI